MMTGAEYPSLGRPPCPADPMAPPPESPSLPSEGSLQARSYSGSGPPPCTGCSQPILDQFILQVQGHTWHSRCLQCAACHVTLTHTCYSGQNQLYCQDDFFRLFGSHCSGCKLSIPPTEVVRRAHDNVYHLNCFRCYVCARELSTGDEFYLGSGGHLLCQADFVKGKEQDENEKPDRSSPMQTSDSVTPTDSQNKDRVLTEYFFSQNSNPKRPEMEEIASRLGMELGEIRTWFKQKRAKTRRKEDNSSNSNRRVVHNRVTSPPGGYPLPIVNIARSPGRLPTSARHPPLQVAPPRLPIGHAPFHQTHLTTNNFQAWEELWSNDFVPPNVDLNPNHLKNGEVIQLDNRSSAPLPDQPMATPAAAPGIGLLRLPANASCPLPLPPIHVSPAVNHQPLPQPHNNNNNNQQPQFHHHHPHHPHHQQQQQQQQQHPCNMSSNNEHGIGSVPWVS